jgi:hypothetical protein
MSMREIASIPLFTEYKKIQDPKIWQDRRASGLSFFFLIDFFFFCTKV